MPRVYWRADSSEAGGTLPRPPTAPRPSLLMQRLTQETSEGFLKESFKDCDLPFRKNRYS